MNSEPTKPASTCPRCGTALTLERGGDHCPRCLANALFAPGGSTPEHVPTSTELEPGRGLRRLGDYELLEEVARGGMGVVYRARQVSLDRIVAVKLMRDSALAGEDEVRRFHVEAAAAAKLKHPNIVAIHEVGETDGQHWFAMDLVEGGNLMERTREGPLAPRVAAELVATIADAVQHAHERGVLHRDLKPSNVLVDRDGQPFVTDFGLARTLEGDSSLTLTGQVLGTPGYMPPEQATGNGTVGPAADIYSLGALLYHLLTGRAPFVGGTPAETMRHVVEQEPVSPQLLNPEVPRDLASVGLKCLAKRPADRYRAAAELASDLRRFVRGEPTMARPTSQTVRLWRWARRNPALACSVAALVFVGALGFAGITWLWREAVAAKDATQFANAQRRVQLWQSLGQQAHFSRLSGALGQRTNTLAAIAAAAEIQPSLALRNDALAALMLPDIGTQHWWKVEQSYEHPWCFDSSLEHYLPHVDFARGQVRHLAVQHSGDHRRVADLGEINFQPSAATFSPDGRWLAVVLANGELHVWDWRPTNRIAKARSSHEALRARRVVDPWGIRNFDFSPDSRALYFGETSEGIRRLALDTGDITPVVPSGLAWLVRVSPSGQRLLMTRKNEAQVWELDPPRVLVRTNFSSFPNFGLLGAAWHPNEELLALGVEGGVHLWHWRSGEARPFPEPPPYPYAPFFNQTGDLFFAGGQVWDVATQIRMLAVGVQIGSAIALSRDERRIAFQANRVGFGVWEFLPPVGGRAFVENPFVFGMYQKPDPSPDGRWLASVQPDGWRLWNVANGRVAARGPKAREFEAKFTADGQAMITVGRDGLKRWPLQSSRTADAQSSITVGPETLLLAGIPDVSTPDTNQPLAAQLLQLARKPATMARSGTVSHGGRFAVLAGGGYAVVTDVARTNCFPRLRLANPNDAEFTLSPAGRWLVTGLHNRPDQDAWDVLTGRRVTSITEPPHPSCFFHNSTGHLVTWNLVEFLLREAGTWRELRRFSWPAGSRPAQLFPGSLAHDGRTLWTTTTDLQLALVDGASGQVFARLERPGGFSPNSMGHDARGDHAYLGTAQNVIRHIDLAALRRELARLGLDWPDEHPGEGFRPSR